MLPVPTLSATIDARGNVTIDGWTPAPRPRAEGLRKRAQGKCSKCGSKDHIASSRRCPKRGR